MTDQKMPSLADLIALTPGAQSLDAAQASITARRAQLLNSAAPPPACDFTAPEPMPLVEAPDAFAQAFFQRLKDKEPPRGAKPRLVIDNQRPPPPDDDDPQPPKAA